MVDAVLKRMHHVDGFCLSQRAMKHGPERRLSPPPGMEAAVTSSGKPFSSFKPFKGLSILRFLKAPSIKKKSG